MVPTMQPSARALASHHGMDTTRRCSALLLALLAGCQGSTSRTSPAPQAPAVAALVDTVATSGLWPGFDARSVPLAIFDGERTWLFRHPSPPAGYAPAGGYPGAVAIAGRDSGVTANSSAMIGEVRTATLMPGPAGETLRQRAAVAVHESFHVFQQQRHPHWTANEGELFTYPATDAQLLAL